MTNDGIIEGHQRHCNSEAYAMWSDLSPVTYFPRGPLLETICTLLDQRLLVSPTRRCGSADIFGSGETRHANAEEFNGWGAVGFYATPLPISL
jgi:hypothetical protein